MYHRGDDMQPSDYENKDAGGAHYDNYKTKFERKSLKIAFAKAWYETTDVQLPLDAVVEAIIVVSGTDEKVDNAARTLAHTWFPKK